MSELTTIQPPERFVMSIGAFLGVAYRIELTEGGLRYESTDGSPTWCTVLVVPEASAWNLFHDALDRANVWQWRPEYHIEALDGSSWSLHLNWGGRQITSEGSNAYPDKFGKQLKGSNPGLTFRRVLRAVSNLAGGRPFE